MAHYDDACHPTMRYIGDVASDRYHKYRPRYPTMLYQKINTYLNDGVKENNYHDLAVDLACGTGLSTAPLAPYFTKVIGVDISPFQIEQAILQNTLSNVEYRVSSADDLNFLIDNSVDLVTCGTAFHWLDHEKVLPVIKRILKPGGVFATYSVSLPILDIERGTALVEEFEDKTLAEFQHPRLGLCRQHYRHIHLPFSINDRFDDMVIEQYMPLSSLLHHLSTYSTYRLFHERHPEQDVLSELGKNLKNALQTSEEDPELHIVYKLFLLVGKKDLGLE